MNRSASMRLALAVGVLVVTTLALAACGGGSEVGGQEDPEARPLPKESQGLQPGEYRSEELQALVLLPHRQGLAIRRGDLGFSGDKAVEWRWDSLHEGPRSLQAHP